MAKEVTVVQMDNEHYVVKTINPQAQPGQTLNGYTNLGAAIKEVRSFFDSEKDEVAS